VERLQQIEEIFQEALQRDPVERDAYVRQACHGDTELQREVLSLLANHETASNSKPWAAAAASKLIGRPGALESGYCLGPYRIESFLAAGGMGEVYRATDTRLNRAVAIKVSAARFSERFEREARVIASLNHPNICQLHDVGLNFLVMELVKGPTLADRIRKGPLPLEDALTIARQIAEALEAAHLKGVVHRDLKPANVKITPDGVVKVLDFGLAKAAEGPDTAGDPNDSPTQTISATPAGVILGTAAYMSPEQARGAELDKRADIWAFGCVLYEMLHGKQTFHGETTSDILAAVLKEEPEWSHIPARVQPLLRRCLTKDPKHRLRDIGDAMPLLEGVPEPAFPRRPWARIAATIVLAVMLAVPLSAVWWRVSAVWWLTSRPAPLLPLVRFRAQLPPDTTVSMRRGPQLALSPDGTRIAVIEQDMDGNSRLATRRLDQGEFAPLRGTEGATMPFFSPDGQWIGFFADGKLKKIGVTGGVPLALCDAQASLSGASWGEDENIIAVLNLGRSLSLIPSGGGPPTSLINLKGERYASPQVLPGGHAVLFSSSLGGSFDDANIDILSFKTGKRKTVLRGGFFGRYLPSGHLIYMHENTLLAAPFDLNRLAVTGAPQPVLEDVSTVSRFGAANLGLSQSGTLVYISTTGELPWSIFWLDRAGNTKPLHLTPGFYWTPRVSPDGNHLAFAMGTSPGGKPDLWVHDLKRDTTSRLTSLPGWNYWPVWTPDSRNIVFASVGSAAGGLYLVRADGSGEPQQLSDGWGLPYSFSPDGKRLEYEETNAGQARIWTAPLEGGPEHPRLGKAEPFLSTPFSERVGALSPDGRWMAYESDETGTPEVYVRPFPGRGARQQISTGGAMLPMWSRGAPGAERELFFLSRADWRIWVADYAVKGDSFVAGKPYIWSQKRLMIPRFGSTFDLASDGRRFAVALYEDSTPEPKPIKDVTVLLNFFDELKRRVPAEGK
jgi:serine/threonine-protein kinase